MHWLVVDGNNELEFFYTQEEAMQHLKDSVERAEKESLPDKPYNTWVEGMCLYQAVAEVNLIEHGGGLAIEPVPPEKERV